MDNIYIIGGQINDTTYNHDVIQFNIQTKTFTNLSLQIIPISFSYITQGWTQINSSLYLLHTDTEISSESFNKISASIKSAHKMFHEFFILLLIN